jgi:hypothetical protein
MKRAEKNGPEIHPWHDKKNYGADKSIKNSSYFKILPAILTGQNNKKVLANNLLIVEQ